jgi:hypothetical protein
MPRRMPDRERAMSFGVPVAERWVAPGTWNAERVLEALHDWTRLVGCPPAMSDWSACRACERGGAGEWERWAREYPRWPEATTVAHYHGTWRAALLAAGLPGGRPRLELSLNDRVDATLRMGAAGIGIPVIASELDVAVDTVRKYLRASRCDCGRNWMVRGPRCSQCGHEEATRSAAAGRLRWDRQRVIAALRTGPSSKAGRRPRRRGSVAGTRGDGGRASTRAGRVLGWWTACSAPGTRPWLPPGCP